MTRQKSKKRSKKANAKLAKTPEKQKTKPPSHLWAQETMPLPAIFQTAKPAAAHKTGCFSKSSISRSRRLLSFLKMRNGRKNRSKTKTSGETLRCRQRSTSFVLDGQAPEKKQDCFSQSTGRLPKKGKTFPRGKELSTFSTEISTILEADLWNALFLRQQRRKKCAKGYPHRLWKNRGWFFDLQKIHRIFHSFWAQRFCLFCFICFAWKKKEKSEMESPLQTQTEWLAKHCAIL